MDKRPSGQTAKKDKINVKDKRPKVSNKLF